MNVSSPEIATTTATASERLLAGFPVPTPEQWRTAAVELLKGAPFEKKLITRTPEGIDLQPIYHARDAAGLGVDEATRQRLRAGPWAIAQDDLPAPPVNAIAIDTGEWHDGGASAVQELAFALAAGIEQLRTRLADGVSAAEATRHARFTFCVGSNLFMEIAKFRAARLVWAQVVRAFGGDDTAGALQLHARTATRNKTAYDAPTNILRTTTEAFSAVVGGCDSLRIGAFDECSGEPGVLAQRIARNLHHILAEECDLARVADPAGGSFYVEWLTDQVARQAWILMQEIERRGGMAAALAAGYPQGLLAETARARAQAIGTRRAVIVGVNQYPNIRETPPRRAEVSTGARPPREAEPFERLRDAAAAFSARTGQPPLLFQANIGPSRHYRLRADWTTGFFEVGGFKVLADRDFKDAGEAATAALASGARLVVINSSDETYATAVEPFARALKAKNPGVFLLVAGATKDKAIEAAWRAAGVDEFVNVTSNALELLTRLLTKIGVLA